MRKFVVTSSNFEGGITLQYDDSNRLVKMDIEALLSEKQHDFFFAHLPNTVGQLEALKQRSSVRVIEVGYEITFEDFYKSYNNKVGKLKAEKAWQRLSRDEQLKAYLYIQKYKNSIPAGIAQLYPATYLNQKRWND